MTLQVKFALYNAISKALISLAFTALLPQLVERIVYEHIDKRLTARSERVLRTVEKGSIDDIVREQDCSFESYSILKEEFVAIYPVFRPERLQEGILIRNEAWSIEGEKLEHRIIRRPFVYDNQIYELDIGEGIGATEELKTVIQRFMLLMMITVILVTLFIDLGFVRLTLKPLIQIMSKKLQPVPSPASFNFEPVLSNTAEFQQLDERINAMMHKLKDTFQMEKEFISNVSHELQTPISIVQNRLENIIIDSKVPDEVIVKLSDSQRTLNRMSRIIKALLLISKIENDQYLKQEYIQIQDLLNEVLEEVEERLQERHLNISREFESDYLFGPCNKALLFTMLMNLVNNAIKYNKDQGSIVIGTHMTDGRFSVTVSDTGIGMEKAELPGIFDRFKRLHKAKADGYGLGLPIVKTIAGFHRIEVTVDSEPDKGTVFTLYFPSVQV